MKKISTTVSMLILVLSINSSSYSQKLEFTKIFSGKNLDGWKIPENNVWWSASKGVLTGKSDADKKGSILWTDQVYKNFIIKLDFKYGNDTIDSGIFIRTVHEQIQLGVSNSLKVDMTCSPYISGKGYPVTAKNINRLLKPKDWNSIKVQALGSKYTVWLNNEKVMTYNSDSAVEEGPIGLQVHPGKDMQIYFKNIKISEL